MVLPLATTVKIGDFDDPTVWDVGVVPGDGGVASHDVRISHAVTVKAGTGPFLIGDGTDPSTGTADADFCFLIDDGGTSAGTPGAKLITEAGSILEIDGNFKMGLTTFRAHSAYYDAGGAIGHMGYGLDMRGGTIRFKSAGATAWRAISGTNATGTYRRVKLDSSDGTATGTPWLIETESGGTTNANIIFNNIDAKNGMFRRLGTSSVSAISHSPGGNFGAVTNPYVSYDNVIFEACGRLAVTTTDAQSTLDFNRVFTFDELNTGAGGAFQITATAGKLDGSRTVKNCGFHGSTAINTFLQEFEVENCVLGSFQAAPGGGQSSQFASWYNNTFRSKSGGGGGNRVYCGPTDAADSEEYRCTERAAGNEKLWAVNNADVPIVQCGIIFEVSQPTNPGNFGEVMSGFADTRDGWGLKNAIVVPCENGDAYSILEYLSSPGTRGVIEYDHVSMAFGARTINLGHSGTDDVGDDRVVMTNCIITNCTAAPYGYIVGLDTTTLQAELVDACLAASFHDNCFWDGYATGNRYAYNGSHWDVGQSAGDPTAALQATNHYINPFVGRSADVPNYLAAKPGNRRVVTYGKFHGITGADDNEIFSNTWRALAASGLGPGMHPSYPSGHTYYNANITPAGLRAWVREDWKPTNEALRNAGDDGVTIGAVEMDEPDVGAAGGTGTRVRHGLGAGAWGWN